MKALLTITRLELRLLLADRVLLLVLGAFAVCTAYALHTGGRFAGDLTTTGQRALAEERAVLKTQRRVLEERERSGAEPPPAFYDPSNPAAVGVFAGRYAVLPPSPFLPLAIGQSDVVPSQELITTQSRWALGDSTDTENPLLLLLGRFDLAFVFIVLYPLVILAASYDLIARERELGRLTLILAQPTTPRRVLGARVLARMLPVIGVGVGASLVGFLLLGPAAYTVEGATRAVLWCALVVAYGSCWFAGAVLVNVLGERSAENALVLLGAWLLFVIVLPSAYDLGVAALHPLPSRVEHSVLAREASREAEERADQLVGEYYRDHPELAPSEGGPSLDFLPKYLAVTERVGDAVAPVFQRFERTLEQQRHASAQLRFVSPALVLQWALCDLAGTGSARWARFRSDVLAFQDEWRAFFLPRAFAKQRLSSRDLAALPDFQFHEEPFVAVATRSAVALGTLLALGAALFTVALRLGARLAPTR